MSAAGAEHTGRQNADSADRRVTPLELFFDLVFVFALTQVTGFLADDPTWPGAGRGALLLATLWWAWVCYSWLTNAVPAEEAIPARLVILSAMAATLVASLAVPGAFGEYGVLFGVTYFTIRFLHVVLYAIATGEDPEERRAVLRLAPGLLGGPALLVVAGFLDGGAQVTLWVVALAVDYGVALVRGVAGLRVHAGHFVERHGLIIIIALGESIVAIGSAGLELDAGTLLAAFFAVVLAAALWWAYFDLVALAAERRLVAAQGHERARLARDSYSYLHLLMVAGIVFVALGVKKTLASVGDPLAPVPAVALCCGVALYLLGHNAFRLRDVGSVSVPRIVVAAVSCALAFVAVSAPALVTLGVLTMVLAALAAFETASSREFRRKLRAR